MGNEDSRPGGADEVSQTNVLQSVGKKGSSQSAEAYLKQAKAVRRGSTVASVSGGGGGGGDDSDEGGTADEDQKAQAEAKAKKAFVKSKASKKSKKEARIKRPGMNAVSVLMEKSLVQARMRHKFTTAAMQEHGYNIDRGLFFGILANMVYFEDHWMSTMPGMGEAQSPDEFSLPLQYVTGHMFAKYDLPSLELKVRPLAASYNHTWDNGLGKVQGGVVTHKGTDTEAMFLTHDDARFLVLTLRGTASMSDAMTDIKYKPSKYKCPVPGNFKVHGGFYKAYQSVAPAVELTMRKLWKTGNFDSVVVCGHSLGGALATLAAIHITWAIGPWAVAPWASEDDRIVDSVSCYTYGSPRVGDKAFRELYNKLVPDTWRHVNDEDGVPCVPPRWLGFRHIGNLVHMNDNGMWVGKKRNKLKVVSDGFSVSERATDHSITLYELLLRELRAAAYMNDRTSELLAKAWATYLNGQELIQVCMTVDSLDTKIKVPSKTKDGKMKTVRAATVSNITRMRVPDQGFLVMFLNKHFGMTPLQVYAVIKDAQTIAETLPMIYKAKIDLDLFRLAFFNIMLEPSTSKRAISMAKAVAHKTFDQFDLNGNSFLNPPEFEDFCVKMFGKKWPMATIRKMLSVVDVNGDGEVSFSEAFYWVWTAKLLGPGDNRVECPPFTDMAKELYPFPTPGEAVEQGMLDFDCMQCYDKVALKGGDYARLLEELERPVASRKSGRRGTIANWTTHHERPQAGAGKTAGAGAPSATRLASLIADMAKRGTVAAGAGGGEDGGDDGDDGEESDDSTAPNPDAPTLARKKGRGAPVPQVQATVVPAVPAGAKPPPGPPPPDAKRIDDCSATATPPPVPTPPAAPTAPTAPAAAAALAAAANLAEREAATGGSEGDGRAAVEGDAATKAVAAAAAAAKAEAEAQAVLAATTEAQASAAKAAAVEAEVAVAAEGTGVANAAAEAAVSADADAEAAAAAVQQAQAQVVAATQEEAASAEAAAAAVAEHSAGDGDAVGASEHEQDAAASADDASASADDASASADVHATGDGDGDAGTDAGRGDSDDAGGADDEDSGAGEAVAAAGVEPEPDAVDGDGDGGAYIDQEGVGGVDYEYEDPTQAEDVDYAELPPNWVAYEDDEAGGVFYYNTVTEESTWDFPTE